MPESGQMVEAKAARIGRDGGRWAAALALVLALVTLPASADPWYVHYENAERALAEEKWSEAVAQIQEALERKGDSGTRVRTYGMRVVDYFPYLKLGIAYYRLGQPAAALEAFETEERLGAVQGSSEAGAELERYRQLASQEEAAQKADPKRQAREVLRDSLAEARRLRAEGQTDEAMKALASGLAAMPEDAEALGLMAQLRERSAANAERRHQQEQARRDLERARTLLGEGKPEAAAGLLRQVLAVAADSEASRLLAQAQETITASLAREERQRRLAAALEDARRLEAAGRFEDALGQLEIVFALEPDHAGAAELRQRLLEAQARSRASVQIDGELAEGERELAAGRFEEALTAANRVLAREKGNARALDLIRRSYGGLSQQLLGGSAVQNLPPAVRFVDQRKEVEGEAVETVRAADFELRGVVIDRSPVTLEFLGPRGSPIEGSQSSQQVGETYVTEFRLPCRLEAGRSVLAVVATDSAGATTRSEYEVLYRRSFFLTPWFWAGAALSIVALALLLSFRRLGQKRALLRRRFNPYVAGSPIFDPDLFFGREPLVQKILQTVHSNSLLLYGERRIGKTSLLHQLHHRLEELEDPEFLFLPVFIDLQGTPEKKFFATLADHVFDTLKPGADRPRALEKSDGYSHHDLVRELHGLLKELQEGSEKRIKVVLLIDEVDELNHYDPRINQGLRSLFMKRFAQSLAAVVAGVGIRKEWEKEGSPWYNFFEEVEVRAIAPPEAHRLVVEPVKELFRFEEGAAERIVELAEGKPFLIQRRCLTLVGRLHEEGRRTVTLADVEALEEVSADVVALSRKVK